MRIVMQAKILRSIAPEGKARRLRRLSPSGCDEYVLSDDASMMSAPLKPPIEILLRIFRNNHNIQSNGIGAI
jgi:hypothetical protein